MPLFIPFSPQKNKTQLGNIYGKIVSPSSWPYWAQTQMLGKDNLNQPIQPSTSATTSQLDPLVASRSLHLGDGVAKILNVPFFGWAYRSSGHLTWIANRESAIQSMQEMGEIMKNKTLALDLPEGTRSVDGTLLPFKKDSHIALQTKLPSYRWLYVVHTSYGKQNFCRTFGHLQKHFNFHDDWLKNTWQTILPVLKRSIEKR